MKYMFFPNTGEEKRFVFFDEYKLISFFLITGFSCVHFLNTSFDKCLFRSLNLLRELKMKKKPTTKQWHDMIMLTR